MPEQQSMKTNVSVKWVAYGVAFLLLGIGTYVACRLTPEPDAAPKAGVTMKLPETVAGLSGEDFEPTEAELAILPADTQFAKRLYKSENGAEQISCQIVLSGSDRRSIHRPEACLRGQGWVIENGGVVPIKLNDGSTLDVMKLTIDRSLRAPNGKTATLRSLYLYWFVSKETTTPYHFARIQRTYLDLLLHNQTHRWAYCIVSAPVLKGFVPGGKNEEQTLEMLKNFIAESAPQFQRLGEGVDIPPAPKQVKADKPGADPAG